MFDIEKKAALPAAFRQTGLGGSAADVQWSREDDWHRIELQWDTVKTVQDDVYVEIALEFQPDFWWMPHLAPKKGNIAQQHIFRSPALIARGSGKTLILLPDVRMAEKSPVGWYLDLDAEAGKMYIGMSKSRISDHVLYEKIPGAVHEGQVGLAFYALAAEEEMENPFRPVLEWYWQRYGREDSEACLGHMRNLTTYTEHTYRWAFETWRESVWQEFTVQDKLVGAPVFIVNVTQSPNYPGKVNEREFRSIWNQAWFCSLRSASGLFRHARRTGRQDLMEYAKKTKELALAFPQEGGLFDSVAATRMELVFEDDGMYNRSCGWDTLFFGNSDRNPFGAAAEQAPRHILDMAVTVWYMLVWHTELEEDARLMDYARAFCDRLITLQDARGFYPAWVQADGKGMGVLDDSPESSMAAAVLLKLHGITGERKYLDSARRALEAVWQEIVPAGRWEDFETYWSCCRYGGDHVGRKFARNGMHKQCNFSMYFTALAFMEAYRAAGDRADLEKGRRVLDEMLMTQSSYQPENIPVPVVGGFGVMNCDAELNDSRESLFAPLIMEYGQLLGCEEYTQRGLAALRAGFSMMYCPDNPQAKQQWEQAWPFFGPADYGFTMENYGHNGEVCDGGLGIGEFTIYDWGNGAASEAWENALDSGYVRL